MNLIEKRLNYILKTKVTDEYLSKVIAKVKKDLKLWKFWFTKKDLNVKLKRDLKILMRDINFKWKVIRKKWINDNHL